MVRHYWTFGLCHTPLKPAIKAAMQSFCPLPFESARRAGMLLAALLFPAISVACAGQQPAPGEALAFSHARHLQHGVNASIWFSQSRDYSIQRLDTFTTPDDLKLIAAMGFDHIRLPVDAAPLLPWLQATHNDPLAKTPFVQELDTIIHAANAHGLAVILDIHPEDEYKATLLHGDSGVGRFAGLWRALARRYAGTDPGLVFFEILNEPEQDDPYRWQGIEAEIAGQIHAIAPEHTIIAAGAHYSGLQDLLALRPLAVPNMIYTFHDYEPFAFTHQSATWTSPQVEPERLVPYPSTPDNVAPNLQQEPDLAGQYFVEQYGLNRWDAERVDRTIAFAEQWGRTYGAPIYCGEFGVLRDHVNPAMRDAWLRDMRDALEKHRIGWAMWDYQTNFGLVTKANGTTTPDAGVLKALGMHLPAD
jgi:endoglucanase